MLKGFDSVLEHWLHRLHDTESSLHIVDLWLHSLDGFHFSGDLHKWLTVVKSLEDSGGEGLLDILDSGSFGHSSGGIVSGLGSQSGVQGGSQGGNELRFRESGELSHVVDVSVNQLVVMMVVSSGDEGDGCEGSKFHDK